MMEGHTIPSFKGGTIHISSEVIDSLSLLDIVWSNKFESENIDPDDAKQNEADFLKGAPPQWLNFYWSEKETTPFVTRNGYNDLIQLVNKNKRKIWSVIDMNLLYQPGSGGSTLAMQVLWKFRKELRCARVTNSTLDVTELSKQVVKLFLVGDDHDQNTVLLLLDIKEKMNEDQPFKRILQDNLIKEINGQNIKANIPVVIILNCIIMDFTRTDELSLEASLSEDEEKRLREKHNEVTEKHEGHEQFRGFNRMLGNFIMPYNHSFPKCVETFTHSPKCCMISTPNGEKIQVRKKETFSKTCLDILWTNMYEDTPFDHLSAKELECEFLTGAQPQWINFYFSEHEGFLFVKRDLYDSLIQQINVQRKSQWNVTTINLFHHPGSGGSTLAMQVLWDMRKHLRCAKLKIKSADTMNIRDNIIKLFNEGGEKNQNTVLLLLDVGEEGKKISYRLHKELDKRIAGDNIPMLIIFNVESKKTIHKSPCVKLKMELLPEETNVFNGHKAVIKDRHGEESEKFHGYNIMHANFRKDFVKNLIKKDLKHYAKANKNSTNTKLFSFLALLNSYIPGSCLHEHLCKEFFVSQQSHAVSFEQIMTQFMDLLVIYTAEHCEDRCVRIAHPMIADACIQMLFACCMPRGEIMYKFLYSIVKVLNKQSDFLHICKDILITRQKGGQEHDKFSKLILDIMEEDNQMNSANCINVLNFASNLYYKDAFYPQALARFYYIELGDYRKAEEFAKNAIQKDPKNSFIRDTLGQVYKNRLRKTVKDKASPNYARRVLEHAVLATNAFTEETKKAEDEQESDSSGSNAANTFNIRGIFGCIQVIKILFDSLTQHSSQWAEFLRGKASVTSLGSSFKDQKLKKYNDFLKNLKDGIKEKHRFFQCYLTYSKPSIEKEEPSYLRRDVDDCYRKYVIQEGHAAQDFERKPASTFPGLMHILNQDTCETELEEILRNNRTISERVNNLEATQNYILANIILCNKSPTLQTIISKRELQQKILINWQEEKRHRSPEFYLLLLLLFWPDGDQQNQGTPNWPNLAECVKYMHQAFERTYRNHLRSRYLVPLFFLGKGENLQRLVHRSKVDQHQMDLLTKGDEKAEIQDLQRVQGEVRDHRVFALRGANQIEVTPHHPASVRGQGPVSFYLGFNIRGPVAYNIRPSHRQCRTCASVRDSTEWDLIEPSVISEDAQNQKYRINLASGCYECSRTGLRIECSRDVQLEYHICDWDCVSDFPEMEHFTPCGPLMDIAVISGELMAVYLPHFLCLGGFLNKDKVRILHVEDSGIAFEKCRLTRFHAKLLDHTFSPKGVLLRNGFPVNYHCETLIYQTLKSHLTLHVYLIPSDKKMLEAVQGNEADSKAITKPGPESSLQMKTWFSLRTLEKMRKSDCNSEVIPEKIQLKYKLIKPNFFEVFIDAPKQDFYLQLMAQQHNEVVWDVKIRQADYTQSTSSVDACRESYSSNAVGNRRVHEILLEHLDNLTSDELKRFNWHLTEGVEAFKKIPESKLEKADRCNIVTCMIDQYEVDGAAKLTVMILKKMQKNNNAKHLQEKLDIKGTD